MRFKTTTTIPIFLPLLVENAQGRIPPVRSFVQQSSGEGAAVMVQSREVKTHNGLLRGSAGTVKAEYSSAERGLFGGEDFVLGEPWYHDSITKEACEKADGFLPSVCERIAWHADYVDSYTYNPLWWFDPSDGGGITRFKASRSIFPDLAKVHFDDLTLPEEVITAYSRYMNGCLVGLHWAAEVYADSTLAPGVDAIEAADNILGVTLHAMQDFYSHSNWIDIPSRRDKIFNDISICQLENTFLYTGYYENEHGIKPHGKFSVICSLTGDNPVGNTLASIMELYCTFNPFADDDTCNEYQDCDNPAYVSGGEVLGIPMPDNLLYVNPPGMALDNTWLAEIGVQVREIELTGAQAFEIAKSRAMDETVHFLEAVGNVMTDEMGHGAFWNKIRTTVLSSESRLRPYEKFNNFPFQFITAGPYPSTHDNGYYLRLNLKTSNDGLSGTDADIFLLAGGMEFPLDYMRGSNILIAYNDFEAGDDTVYTVGPFSTLPSEIVLKNDAPDTLDIIVQFGREIVDFFVSVGELIKDLFTNDMDYIGTGGALLDPTFLDSIPVGGSEADHVYIDGGGEGKYRVYYEVMKLSENAIDAEATFRVKLTSLYCKEESDFDSLTTTDDEPILMAVLAAYPGERQSIMKTFKNVDSGESRDPDHTFEAVTLPTHGAMVLSFRMYESDGESTSDREDALAEFVGEKEEEVEESLLVLIGEAVAADWKLESIRVYGFHRGTSLQAGQVLHAVTNHWIDGGESRTYSLDSAGLQTLPGVSFECQVAGETVTAFSLVDGIGSDLGKLLDGLVMEAKVGLKIVADIIGNVQSVVFGLDDEPSLHIADVAPYSFEKADFSSGFHKLTATPYTEKGGGGTAGTPLTITFGVEGAETPEAGVKGFTLIDSKTDQVLGELTNGYVVKNQQFNIRANVEGDIESVVFHLDGKSFRTENVAPYAFCGDVESNYYNCEISPGEHTVKATPFSEDKGGGVEGKSESVTFTVESVDTPEASVKGFTVIDSSTDQVLGELTNGYVVKNQQFNIRANVEGDVESVVFHLDGKSFRTENVSPYAFCGDVESNYYNCEVSPGEHTIKATPFSEDKGGGVEGKSESVTFTVEYVGASVKSFTLVDGSNDSDLSELKNGGVIQDGSHLNIRANVEGNVESVVFYLDSELFRTENEAPYAFCGNEGGNYLSYDFKPGKHTVMAKPFSKNNGSGFEGTAKSVTFEVKGPHGRVFKSKGPVAGNSKSKKVESGEPGNDL